MVRTRDEDVRGENKRKADQEDEEGKLDVVDEVGGSEKPKERKEPRRKRRTGMRSSNIIL